MRGERTGPHPRGVSTGDFSPEWLTTREEADAAARAHTLLDPLRTHLAHRTTPLRIHDIGAGTGSMPRWIAPRLPGPQAWILHDNDPRLLDRVAAGKAADAADAADATVVAADGTVGTVGVRPGDLNQLSTEDFAGAALVTGSAILDLLTHDELSTLAIACVRANCAVLWSLSVTGRVILTPPHPLDSSIAAAFDAHQRRTAAGRTLLGPDAPSAAAGVFRRHDCEVFRRPSPWILGPNEHVLLEWWLHGWVAAAVEQCPDLAPASHAYLRQRVDAMSRGGFSVVVDHEDLLVLPPRPRMRPV